MNPIDRQVEIGVICPVKWFGLALFVVEQEQSEMEESRNAASASKQAVSHLPLVTQEPDRSVCKERLSKSLGEIKTKKNNGTTEGG